MSVVEVVPAKVSLIPGRSTQFSAAELDGSGNLLTESGFTWSVDEPTIADIDADGLVLALRPGLVRVFATLDGVTGEAFLRIVRDLNISSVAIAPTELNITIGDVSRLAATAYNAYGEEVVGQLQFWSSTDISIATVDSNGLVVALAAGVADISVEIGGSQAFIQVVVV